MIDVWLLDTNEFNTFAWYEDHFSDSMISYIHDLAKLYTEEKAKVGMDGHGPGQWDPETARPSTDDLVKEHIRKSNITWIEPEGNSEWLFRHLTDVIKMANQTYFDFDLVHIEPLQYTVYNEGEYYTKHIDTTWREPGRYPRKLSFSVQLSDPSEYDGGDLVLYTDSNPFYAKREKGSITFFPSFVMHEVTPVTRGTRKALVGWVRGPKWK